MLENVTAVEFLEVLGLKEVIRLWKDSIKGRSGIVFATTTKILAKKGKYELMQYFILNEISNFQLSLRADKEFTNIFAQTLYELRNSAPILGKLGRYIQEASFEKQIFGSIELKDFLDKISDHVYMIDRKDLDEALSTHEITMYDYLCKPAEEWSSVFLAEKNKEFEASMVAGDRVTTAAKKGKDPDDDLFDYFKSLSRHDFKSMKADTRKKLAEMLTRK